MVKNITSGVVFGIAYYADSLRVEPAPLEVNNAVYHAMAKTRFSIMDISSQTVMLKNGGLVVGFMINLTKDISSVKTLESVILNCHSSSGKDYGMLEKELNWTVDIIFRDAEGMVENQPLDTRTGCVELMLMKRKDISDTGAVSKAAFVSAINDLRGTMLADMTAKISSVLKPPCLGDVLLGTSDGKKRAALLTAGRFCNSIAYIDSNEVIRIVDLGLVGNPDLQGDYSAEAVLTPRELFGHDFVPLTQVRERLLMVPRQPYGIVRDENYAKEVIPTDTEHFASLRAVWTATASVDAVSGRTTYELPVGDVILNDGVVCTPDDGSLVRDGYYACLFLNKPKNDGLRFIHFKTAVQMNAFMVFLGVGQ